MVAAMEAWPNTSGFDTSYEEHDPVDLVVKGEIPHYAAGVLYRTGPLGYKAKTDDGKIWSAKHWFDGFSGIHRFQIDFPDANGPAKVQYRSRRTVDEYLEIVRKTGRVDSTTFGPTRDPCESYFKKVSSMFASARDAGNVGVTLSINMPGGGFQKPMVNGHTNGIVTLHAKTDSSQMKKLNPETLEPIGMADQSMLHPDLKGAFSAAHAKADPKTGDVFNFNLDFGRKCTYRIFLSSPSTDKTEILATFTGTPAYIHSIFLSENHVILCTWSSYIAKMGLPILYNGNVAQAIAPFDPKINATWYVVDRTHGKGLVATYTSKPFFCFHSVNAWEEPSASDPTKTDIITELGMFENNDVVKRFYYENIVSSVDGPLQFQGENRKSSLPMQAQFRLPHVNHGKGVKTPGKAELLFQAPKAVSMELPTINPRYLTQRHRFSYGCADRLKSSFMDGIVKFDNTTQTSVFWETEGHTPGEPIFVANPDGTEEDDGVVLSVVLDGFEEKSYLLVLRARDLKELGRAEMRGPMGFGFHGAFKAGGRGYAGDI